ncbi:hypothetical protein, partial [Gemmiger formicilis]|uniref:hypothetical protein n=1 Tax=Gemmiger formicilis TaxID=745368 RepID=UPI003076FB8C
NNTQNNPYIYRHYRLLFWVEIVNILYMVPACFVHFDKWRFRPAAASRTAEALPHSLALTAPLCRRGWVMPPCC